MARLLIRSGKSPFTPVAAETTLAQDVFNSNSGNYLFQHAVWRSLAVDGTEVVTNSTLSERRRPEADDAARIDEEFDHVVVPLANAFRPEFAKNLRRLTALLERLTVPVTVVGVGAQAAHGQGPETLADIDPLVKRFMAAVLDRSASVGVRGEFTQRYLAGLGFGSDVVEVIGCPSMFLWGPDHRVHRKVEAVHDGSRLALNLTPEVPGIGAFATAQAERHPDLVYVGQDAHDLRLLLWGIPFPHVHDPQVPVHLDHALYQQDRMRLFLDTWSWYDALAERDFVYGTRFHGNVAGLLAGTPAMLLAHDSRTTELAEYHRMPFVLMPQLDAGVRADALHEATDLAALNEELPHGFARYTAFLERNGLEHRWQEGRTGVEFDADLAAARPGFPPPVRPLSAPDLGEVASRLNWLRQGMVLDITRHPQRYDPPFPHPGWKGAGSRYARLLAEHEQTHLAQEQEHRAREQELAGLRDRLATLESRQAAREARSARARWRRLRAKVSRLLRR